MDEDRPGNQEGFFTDELMLDENDPDRPVRGVRRTPVGIVVVVLTLVAVALTVVVIGVAVGALLG